MTDNGQGSADLLRRDIGCRFLAIVAKIESIDLVKRGQLERVLRYIAFSHKSNFRDLKNTALVQTWERSTGLTW